MTPDQPTWLQGTEPGRHAVALGIALVLTVVAIDYLLVARLSLFFDLAFITLCLYLAVRVEHESLHVAAMLPPILLAIVLLLLGAIAPEMTAEPDDGVVQTFVTGAATHSVALVVGWALALVAVEVRRRGLFDTMPSDRG